jgi:outer membrane protein TolC
LGVATASLLPSLRLAGSLGSSGDSFSGIGDAIVRSLQASVAVPLFRGGQLVARRQQQQAAVEAALAGYRAVVLRAVEEAEAALLATQAAAAREQRFTEAETAAGRAAEMARARYAAGLVDFQSVLEAERSLLNSQDGRIAAQAARASATIQLYKALGGDWTTASEDK